MVWLWLSPGHTTVPGPNLASRRSTGDGDYEICDDFIVDEWLRKKIRASEDELQKEKECVSHLIGMVGGSCALRGVEDTTVPGEN